METHRRFGTNKMNAHVATSFVYGNYQYNAIYGRAVPR